MSGVTTQGRPADNQQFVKSYYISVSDDGQAFTDIVGSDGTRMVSYLGTLNSHKFCKDLNDISSFIKWLKIKYIFI